MSIAAAQPVPPPGLAEALEIHQSGDLVRAEVAYRKVLAAHPRDGWALHLLAMILFQRIGAQLPEALGLVERFVSSPVADAATIASIGGVLDEVLQLDRVLDVYINAGEKDGSPAHLDGGLGRLAERLRGWLLRTLTPHMTALQKVGRSADERLTLLYEALGLVDAAPEQGGFFFGDRLASLNKSCGFQADEKFMRAFERNARETGEEPGRAWRLHTLTWAAKHALKLDGDFVECGVFEGFMSSTVAEYVDFASSGKTFHLFDTFEGFSPRYSSPADFGVHEGFFKVAQEIYGRPGLYESVVERFRPYPNIKVIRGVVPDVLLQAAPARIAYCHIDLNSPAAEVGALDVLFDRIVPGGLVVFDDYGWLPFAKQKEAEDGFAAARGYCVLELPTGQGLLIKR